MEGGRESREGSQGPVSPALLAETLAVAFNQRGRLEDSEEMFATVGNRMEELENSISSFNEFLKEQEMYSYVHGIVRKFFKLSQEMKRRMQDISTLYSFLNSYQLSASKTSAGYFSVLPQEICLHILSFLDWRDLNNISLLNRQWRDLSRDNMLWKGMCYYNWKRIDDSIYDSDKGDSSPETASELSDEHERREHEQRSKKRLKKSWKDIFMKRLRVEDNWRLGNVCASKIVAQGESAAFCLQFDDKHLVTATDVIQVLDINTGECIRTMQGHRDSVMCLDFNKQYIVSGSKDNSIRVWDINSGACVNVLEGHDNGVRTLRFDGRQIVSGARDSTIKLWDMHTGELQNTLRGHHYTVYCLELDKRHIISGSVDKTIRLWDRDTGQEIRTMKGHTNSIRCLKFDQSTIVSGAWDNRVIVWDLETGKEIHRFEGHADRVMCVQFDERKIVSGSVDKLVKIWDLRAEGACHTLAGHDYTVYHLAFDDYKIVSASKDRTVITWDFTTEIPLEKRKGTEILHSFDTSTHHISTNGTIVRNWSVAMPPTSTPASGSAASAPSSGGYEFGHAPSTSNSASNAISVIQPMDYSFLGRLYPSRPAALNVGNTASSTENNDALNHNDNNNTDTPDTTTNNNYNNHSTLLSYPSLSPNNHMESNTNPPQGSFFESVRRRRERKLSIPMFAFGGASRGGTSGGTLGGQSSSSERNAGMLGTGGMLGMRDRLRHFGYPSTASLSPSPFHTSQGQPFPPVIATSPDSQRNPSNFLPPPFPTSSSFLPPYSSFGHVTESTTLPPYRPSTTPNFNLFPQDNRGPIPSEGADSNDGEKEAEQQHDESKDEDEKEPEEHL